MLKNFSTYNPGRPQRLASVSQGQDDATKPAKSPAERRLTTIEAATRPPFDRSISANDGVSDEESGLLRLRAFQATRNRIPKKPKKVSKGEQIRRVAELVALYRCKFKQGASDASIMGTLHLAASIIQIHFRYQKQLKEAQRAKVDFL